MTQKTGFFLFILIFGFVFLSACQGDAETAVSPTPSPTNRPPTATPQPVGPVAYYGELIVVGNRIHGAHTGEPAQVRGMSFFWSNTGWGQEDWYTAVTVDQMVDEYHVELVRAAMGVDESGGYLYGQAANQTRVETVVDAAIARNIYVIIDWHTHHAEDNPDEAVAFFAEMAEKYGEYDNVIFEIYNEPLDTTSWETIKSYAEQVIPAIREHSDNLIVVGTPTWSQNVDQASLDPIDDPNLAYSFHFYVGSHGNFVRSLAETALDNGAALFVTEWGIWPEDWGPDGMDEEDWMAFVDEHQLSWANWAISDKVEPPSFFTVDGTVSENGRFVQEQLEQAAQTAPWR